MIPFWPGIQAAAHSHGLDPLIVAALVQVESGFDPWAWNPEPRYRYLWDVRRRAPFRRLTPEEGISETPPPDFPVLAGDRDQEWWGQQASWGLMQVMGAVAREAGCLDAYLTQLCNPVLGLAYGCRHLAAQMKWANGNVEQALAAYNGGRGGNEKVPYRNAVYAAKVIGSRPHMEGVLEV